MPTHSSQTLQTWVQIDVFPGHLSKGASRQKTTNKTQCRWVESCLRTALSFKDGADRSPAAQHLRECIWAWLPGHTQPFLTLLPLPLGPATSFCLRASILHPSERTFILPQHHSFPFNRTPYKSPSSLIPCILNGHELKYPCDTADISMRRREAYTS